MIEWRPNALRSNGAEHTRYRTATSDALAGVNLYTLRSTVERAALPLVNSFCETGSADLIGRYILPLVFVVLNELIGCPPAHRPAGRPGQHRTVRRGRHRHRQRDARQGAARTDHAQTRLPCRRHRHAVGAASCRADRYGNGPPAGHLLFRGSTRPDILPDYIQAWLNYADWDDTTFAAEDPIQ